ncbi:MAG: methylenetetrahydrofolate reductase C-terminal domain-containing protein [Candidatus Thermoplasmatota archaeon]
MIISRPKKLDDCLQILGSDPVFLIGCSDCATICHTGGESEILEMKKLLEARNLHVTGLVILDPACHLQNNKRLLKSFEQQVARAKKIFVLACGNGVQTVAELFEDKDIVAGSDSLFIGEIKRLTEFEKRCMACGDCLVDSYGGLCPISRCAKSMLNGPCGGSRGGRCEINPDIACVWEQIYRFLMKKGRMDIFHRIQPPKDWSKSLEMQRSIHCGNTK